MKNEIKTVHMNEILNALENINNFLEELFQLDLPVVNELREKYGIVYNPPSGN